MKTLRAGITLPEILVVTVIIAVLIAVLLPAALIARRKGDRASCLMNLRQIGLALAAYRQDTGVYPEPGKPIGALAAAYPKLLAKIPHCPSDPERDRDSYGEYYNYWGYNAEQQPTALRDIAQADGVYGPVQASYSFPTSRLKWLRATNYIRGNVIQPEVVYYLCLKDHVSDDYVDANNNGIPDLNEDSNPNNNLTLINKPLVGTKWKEYWQPIPGAYLWKNGHPDSDFPGLVNPNPPSNTIVTVCPFHVRSDRCYTVLRVSGETENVPQSKTSNEFWTLSQMP
jgi:type II secretory pathway pseudopilin PulG